MGELSKLSPNALSAAMRGGTDGWGQIADATTNIRYAEPVKSRRRCHCGCKTKVTHGGFANGIIMTKGCELYVRRWVTGKLFKRIPAPPQASPIGETHPVDKQNSGEND